MKKNPQAILTEILNRLEKMENGNDSKRIPTPVSLLRLPEVETATGLKKSKIHQMIQEGTFPAGVKLTGRSRAWRSDSIQEWILSRPEVTIEKEAAA